MEFRYLKCMHTLILAGILDHLSDFDRYFTIAVDVYLQNLYGQIQQTTN